MAATFGLVAVSTAQFPGVQGSVERQIQLLEQKKQFAAGQISIADEAMVRKDYETAYAHFKSAVDILPQGGVATSDVRSQALDGFCDAAVKLARRYVSTGNYADAKTIVEVPLEESYNPNYEPALSLRSQLLSPDGFIDRGTLTPRHIQNVEEVKDLLKQSEGYFATGRYDDAFKRCERVLNVDKYNIAARKLMERINGARQKYAEAAYNETRGDLLMQTQKAWQLPSRKFNDGPTAIIEQAEIFKESTKIPEKLEKIIIPKIDFTDATIPEVVAFLTRRSEELDTIDFDDQLKGVNIFLDIPDDSPEASYPITLSLSDVPLGFAIESVARIANLKQDVQPYAVVLTSQLKQKIITREYKVPRGFIKGSKAKIYLEEKGIEFPEGASAAYSLSTGRLRVSNTAENLDRLDMLVDGEGAQNPTQIEIEARFLEVTQNNLDELGFDWLLGQFALAGGSGVYGSGGTPGFGRTINNNSYPITNPSTGLPVGASNPTSGSITAGNRAGGGGAGYETAISLNGVDALLLNTPAGAPTGILSVAGIFTNPQFQVVLRALSQKKGVDLISSPKVTAKNGQRATIEIIRDFRYPTQFDPPQLSGTNGAIYTPIVPSTPTGWETKPVGITLEVEATIGPDNYTIDLNLAPRVVEFEGFINYGNPVNATVARVVPEVQITEILNPVTGILDLITSNVRGFGPSTTFEATPNTINMPVFSTREVVTLVSVYDGQTVALGGLMREDVQKIQDKVPILGDIPFAGRLFRSNVDQHIKRNLVMFVTASLMDPAGQPLIKADEEDAIPNDILSNP